MISSYVPQVQLILLHQSTTGIAQSYIMFTYIFTATQSALIVLYYSRGIPLVNRIRDGDLKGFDAYGAIVGPLQIVIQWIGSTLA